MTEAADLRRAFDRLWSPRGTFAHGMAVFPIYRKIRWALLDGEPIDDPALERRVRALGAPSPPYEEAFPYPDHAVGMLVALGGRMVGGDVFDAAATAARFWRRLILAYAKDACDKASPVPTTQPEYILGTARRGNIEVCGRAALFQAAHGISGSALMVDGRPLHIAIFVKEAQQMLTLEMLPVEMLDADMLVYIVRGFLTSEECDAFIQQTEAIGYEGAPISTAAGPLMAPDVRNNTRVMLDDVPLAERMWGRIQPYVPEALLEWEAVGLNERWRFYRYDRQQHFAKHYDGRYRRSQRERSQITFMVYLNDGFEGGATSFYTDVGDLRFRVRPQRGAALLFLHAQLHEGSPVSRGRKYVMRTDVMYRHRGNGID